MNRLRWLSVVVLAMGGIGLSFQPALGQVTLDISPTSAMGGPGDTIEFFGKLINTGSSPLFLNGDSLNVPGLIGDDTLFLTNAPQILNAGESYSGEFFTLTVDLGTILDTYVGSFSVVGGAGTSTYDVLASQTFSVTVANSMNVPEGGPLLIWSAMLMTLGLHRRRVRRKPDRT